MAGSRHSEMRREAVKPIFTCLFNLMAPSQKIGKQGEVLAEIIGMSVGTVNNVRFGVCSFNDEALAKIRAWVDEKKQEKGLDEYSRKALEGLNLDVLSGPYWKDPDRDIREGTARRVSAEEAEFPSDRVVAGNGRVAIELTPPIRLVIGRGYRWTFEQDPDGSSSIIIERG